MLRGSLEKIPVELEDVAGIDGCSRLQTPYNVYLPIAAPGLAALVVISRMWIWNVQIIGLSFTFETARTFTVMTVGFRGFGSMD